MSDLLQTLRGAFHSQEAAGVFKGLMTAFTAARALGGTTADVSVLNATNISSVVLTYPTGGMVVTNDAWILELIQAMRSAPIDNTLYDTAMTFRIEFFSNVTKVATVSAGDSLFRIGASQYHDRTGKFQEVIRKLTGRNKTPSLAAD